MYLSIFNDSDYNQLSKDEERLLFIKYRENNDLSARDKILFANLKLAYKLANKQNISTLESITSEDLYQQSVIIILKAIETFDYNADIKFSTYIYKVIQGQLIRYISTTDRLVRIPVHMINDFSMIRKYNTELEQKYDGNISFEILNKEKKITKTQYDNYINYYKNVDSLYKKPINKHNDKNNDNEILCIIKDDKNIEDEIIYKDTVYELKNAINNLNEQDKKLIVHVYIKNNTLLDYSRLVKINRRNATERRKKAIKKLKEALI